MNGVEKTAAVGSLLMYGALLLICLAILGAFAWVVLGA